MTIGEANLRANRACADLSKRRKLTPEKDKGEFRRTDVVDGIQVWRRRDNNIHGVRPQLKRSSIAQTDIRRCDLLRRRAGLVEPRKRLRLLCPELQWSFRLLRLNLVRPRPRQIPSQGDS